MLIVLSPLIVIVKKKILLCKFLFIINDIILHGSTLENEIYRVQRSVWNEEDFRGVSTNLAFIQKMQMALMYCMLIYDDITRPNRAPNTETWEEVKTRFDFNTHKTLFSNHRINLLKVAGFFDLELLAPLSKDAQFYIDAQPNNDTPTYP